MSQQRNKRNQRRPRAPRPINEGWIPKTKLGELVQSGLITLDKIFANNLVVKEKEIINVLLPQLKESVITINMVQQMTASGQRSRFKAVVIVGTDGWGAYVSTNNGSTWEESDTGLPNSFAAIHALTTSNTKIYAGTLFIGAWERPLTDYVTGVEPTNNQFPSEYSLQQNYPNPFNPSTTIEFSVPQESFVELKVFDVLGNEVSTLVSDTYSAGNYKTDFRAEKLPSGMYIARISAGNFVQTKKMILLK